MGEEASHRPARMTQWLRLLRSRNGLVRTADRIEAAVVGFCVTAALGALPVVGVIGSTVHADLLEQADRQRAESRPTIATLVSDAPPAHPGTVAPVSAPVEWTAAGGRHTGTAHVPAGSKAGVTVTVWVDGRGERVPQPLTDEEAALNAALNATRMWLGFVALLATVCCLGHWLLNRRRYAAWAAEWHRVSRTWGTN
ncbi:MULTISPECIES: hypothetical protein [Thermocrispum]|jgi:hypothetical protein|uniref:Transmembrane protein n=1 Tax=Thermocrispum agreste TaxID=37925 RepID=A0A2W4JR22_9PSEU|nr:MULTISPECIES: hypothetical protein [Thermocrispum]PZN00842.1 MAG: hypothetical protein DIU77_02535 [Thermocrispum agreste]